MTRTAAAALAASLTLAACHGGGQKASLPAAGEAPARAVRVGKPALRLETGLARATGTVRSREDTVLAAKATGQIRRLLVGVGDRVRAGQALVEMDSTNATIGVANAQAAVKLAEANLAAAERELKRAQSLYDQQSAAEMSLDRARTGQEMAAAQLEQARAGLRMAEQMLADTVLRAPFDGVITGKFANAGDTVTLMPVSPIVKLTDVDRLEVRLAVPEGIEPFVQTGQKIEGVTTPGGQRFDATVRVKGAVVDPASRTVEVLVDVAKGAPLRPGTLVNVDFGGFGDKDGLYVPTSALRSDDKGAFVFVVAGGKAERRAVQTTPVNPGTVAVRGGLDAGLAIILDPGSLAAGDAVVPLAD